MTDVVNMCILHCQFQMSFILTVFLVSIQRNGFHWDVFFSHMDIDTLSLAILLLVCAPNSCSPLVGLLHSTTLPFLLSLVHLYLFPLDRRLFFHSSICTHTYVCTDAYCFSVYFFAFWGNMKYLSSSLPYFSYIMIHFPADTIMQFFIMDE